MSAIANMLALKELSAALSALDAPFSLLPEVKNKNGDPITDVKEKRLELVRQHVQAAGDVISLAHQALGAAEMGIQAALAQKYRPQIEAALKEGGLDPEGCDCPSCTARRVGEQKDEPFGFAAGVKRMEEARK